MASHYTHIDEADRIALAQKMEQDSYKTPTAPPPDLASGNLIDTLLRQMKSDPQLQRNVIAALFAQGAET